MTVDKQKRGRGRPRAGESNTLVSADYAALTVRIPPVLRAQLYALSALTRTAASQIIVTALREHIEGLPKADREALNTLAERFEERTSL